MAKKGKRKAAPGDVATNRQAAFRYHLDERIEAGIELQGSEVKSMRNGGVQLKDAYAEVRDGEVWIQNMHVAPYKHAGRENHEPERPRKLLLHRKEIERLIGSTSERGLTIVPPASTSRARARRWRSPWRAARTPSTSGTASRTAISAGRSTARWPTAIRSARPSTACPSGLPRPIMSRRSAWDTRAVTGPASHSRTPTHPLTGSTPRTAPVRKTSSAADRRSPGTFSSRTSRPSDRATSIRPGAGDPGQDPPVGRGGHERLSHHQEHAGPGGLEHAAVGVHEERQSAGAHSASACSSRRRSDHLWAPIPPGHLEQRHLDRAAPVREHQRRVDLGGPHPGGQALAVRDHVQAQAPERQLRGRFGHQIGRLGGQLQAVELLEARGQPGEVAVQLEGAPVVHQDGLEHPGGRIGPNSDEFVLSLIRAVVIHVHA